MKIISVRKQPEYAKDAIKYIQSKWANERNAIVYEDCITQSLVSAAPLPQWYLLIESESIIGCAGLITNDFISRMDLYPWVCAVYIEEEYRGNNYGALLLKQAQEDTKLAGFDHLYLCTDHIGYYEHYGFEHIGRGYHLRGDSSRIYSIEL